MPTPRPTKPSCRALRRTGGARTNVTLTGWQQCTSSNQAGLHVTVQDVRPNTSKLGKELNGVAGGVTLNFTFNAWAPIIAGNSAYCTLSASNRNWCISTMAVHEFGHALGFDHEQNRPDDPTATCAQDTNKQGDTTIGPWDADSAMNYCSSIYNNNGQLSFWDIVGTQQFYGMPLVTFPGTTRGTPALERNQDGRLEVFTRDGVGRLVHSWQVAPNGPFVAWYDFGFSAKFPPTVARNDNGTIVVFAVDNNGTTFVSKQSSPNGPFGPMQSLGGITLFQPTVGRNADGRLEVFVVGTTRQLWHKWQTSPGGPFVDLPATGGWSPMDANTPFATQPVIGTNLDGTMELFGVNWYSGVPFHARQVSPSNYFGGFIPLDGVMADWTPLAIARNADGRLEAFGLGYYDLALYHWTQRGTNSANFSSISRLTWTKTFSGMPTVFTNADGTLEILGVSQEAGLVHAWQIAANQQFTDFFSLRGAPSFSPTVAGIPAIGVNSDGRRELFVQGSGGNLMHAWQASSYRVQEPDGSVMPGLIWTGR